MGLLLNCLGDLGDLVPALDKSMRPAWHSMGPSELQDTLAARGKCSALVKIAGALRKALKGVPLPRLKLLLQLLSVYSLPVSLQACKEACQL